MPNYKDFEDWLNKEYPAHSEYDFDSRFAYESWIKTLYKAYEAGYNVGCDRGFESGVSQYY